MAAKVKRKRSANHQHFVEPTPERYQHGDVIIPVATDIPGVRAPRIETQTVIDRYRMATKKRKPLITRRQHEAAVRLYADWYNSGSAPRVVASYEHQIPGAGDQSDRQIRARDRYERAIQAVGIRLSGVLTHVCLHDLSVSSWARQKGYAPQAGMAALHLALDTLADHYRLTNV